METRTFTCAGCGVAFTSTRKRKRCRTGCLPVRACKECGTTFRPGRAETVLCGVRCARVVAGRASGAKKSANRKLVSCPRCGTDFWPWANMEHARQFCSRVCAFSRPKKAKPARQSSECEWCCRVFVGRNINKKQRTCSKACNNRLKSRARKLREKGLNPRPLSAVAIARRDGTSCHICGKYVDMAAVYPSPLSATVDHVIPITRGGSNEPHNLKLAHARCDMAKGNRIAA